MPTEATIYNWGIQDVEFFEKLSRAQEIRKEATRHKMIALADRVLTDDKLDHQRAAVAGALWFKAEQISAPRHRVELTGRNGRPIQMDDGEPDLVTMARKVALAFRLIAMHDAEAGLSEDVGDGRA